MLQSARLLIGTLNINKSETASEKVGSLLDDVVGGEVGDGLEASVRTWSSAIKVSGRNVQ